MNQSITLDKHEMVVDKEVFEALVEACKLARKKLLAVGVRKGKLMSTLEEALNMVWEVKL